MFINAAAVLFFLSPIQTLAQSQPAPPSFEVADVQINKSGEARMAVDFLPGGKLSMRNVPMKIMIAMAYHVRPDALTGGPGWLDSDRFDVVAKALQTTSSDEIRLMLRTLLAERFKLAVHADHKMGPAYALMVGKTGPKLQASEAALLTDQRCGPGEGAAGQKHVACQHITMAMLAEELQEIAPRDIAVPVVDQTSLPGAYNFNLDWTPAVRAAAGAPPDPSHDTPDSGPTLFDALETQLGLKLESKKLPLPVIVIDRVERTPAENS
jgi:uncharacterized protein (TIGR03435 family)